MLSLTVGINAIAVAVGAFVAGRPGDRFGCKKIYTGDLVLYMAGALWPLQRIWSTELFLTEIRNTGQGFVWAAMLFLSGVWAPFLLAKTGVLVIAMVMTLMVAYNLVVGTIWCPKTSGQSLEQITEAGIGG